MDYRESEQAWNAGADSTVDVEFSPFLLVKNHHKNILTKTIRIYTDLNLRHTVMHLPITNV